MVDLGCQDTDWVGGNDKQVSDAIPRQYGLILVTLGKENVAILGAFLAGLKGHRW